MTNTSVTSGQTSNGVTVTSGNVLYVVSGGKLTNAIISSGGTDDVYGGVASNTRILSGGTERVTSGGIVTGSVLSGGALSLQPRGTSINAKVSSGGILTVASSGTASGTTIYTSGQEVVYSGGKSVNTTLSGGVESVAAGGTATNTVVHSGAQLNVAGTVTGTVVSSGGTLHVYSGTTATATSTTLMSGATIDKSGLAYVSGGTVSVNTTSDVLTVTEGANTYTEQLVGDYTGRKFALADDGSGGTLISDATCFLADTMIATPSGERAVQEIAAGDLVSVMENGKLVARPAAWVGSRAVRIGVRGYDAYPVRIRAHAFAQNVPHRDLLVTPEHCILVEGNLIPARMLVNDVSIITDRSIDAYTFFHIELETHGILLAEGLTTESYLDTGNRTNFANAGVTAFEVDLAVDAHHKAWTTDAAAPLVTDRAIVEPIWTALAERARTLGLTGAKVAATLIDDAELRLLTDTGVVIGASTIDGNVHSFDVPAGVTGLRLISRSFRPSDVFGPFIDDRRTLGVMVGRISCTQGGDVTMLDAHLSVAELDGWQPAEGAARWTAGNAVLPIDLPSDTALSIDIEIVTTGRYLVQADKRAA